MRYFFIAGEASGDLHGSKLIKSIREKDDNAEIECWGGDRMMNEGAILHKHYRELAFMGFFVVIRNIFTILGFFRDCKRQILAFKPDVVVLIDYPGFNLRMAKYLHKKRIKVFYYISPKIWAWNQNRAIKIKQYVDHMFTIFPFETDFYKKFNYEVDFVGNPIMDSISTYRQSKENRLSIDIENVNIIALLPGSRKQEIRNSLPVMMSVMEKFRNYLFIIAGAPGIDESFYKQFTGSSKIPILFDETYSILEKAKAALVTSGTATLETALFKVPQVVCYKTGNFTYEIARRLIRVKYISLVNLIMDKRVVVELIQQTLMRERLEKELNKILFDDQVKKEMIENYNDLELKLGGAGASERAATKMLNYLTQETAKG